MCCHGRHLDASILQPSARFVLHSAHLQVPKNQPGATDTIDSKTMRYFYFVPESCWSLSFFFLFVRSVSEKNLSFELAVSCSQF